MSLDLNAIKLDKQYVVECIDTHTAGEPLRTIVAGIPEPQGQTMLAKRRYCQREYEHYRRALMFEPRGHADMYGALITEPEHRSSNFGVLFMHNEGYSTMCGHAIIALTQLHKHANTHNGHEEVALSIDTPAGTIHSFYRDDSDIVKFTNVPAYVHCLDESVHLPLYGQVSCDVAFGGAFYGFVNADELDISLSLDNHSELISVGQQIKAQLAPKLNLDHPDADMNFLYGIIFYSNSQLHNTEHFSRHVCIFAEGELDRSPTGTGVSARVAILHQRNQLKKGQSVFIEGILGAGFHVAIDALCVAYQRDAIVPVVSGQAYITGTHQFYLDPQDPLIQGFILR